MREGLVLKKAKKRYNGIYRGLVVDNNDPLQYGRVKVQVYPMLKDIVAAHLPWSVPAMPLFDGAGLSGSNSFGAFVIPKIGTFVYVFFEEGCVRQPIHFAEAQTAQNGLPPECAMNYPDRKVYLTKNGIQIYIDDAALDVKVLHPKGTFVRLTDEPRFRVEHPTGSYVELDENGDVKVHANRDIIATAERHITATAKLGDVTVTAEKGNASVWAFGSIALTALVNIALNALGTISILAQNLVGPGGTSDITIDGDVDIKINGDVDADITGDVDIEATGVIDITGSAVNINP